MKVSLYIPSFNHAHFLERSLPAVLSQSFPVEEILVIDDGSSDNTKEVVAKFPVRYLKNERGKGLSCARNMAVLQAKGDFIASLDADCVAHKDWLKKLMSNFTSDNISGVGGRLHEEGSGLIDLWRKEHMAQDWGSARIIDPPFLYGSNTVFKKSSLSQIGLYSEHYKTNNEDLDISLRLKKQGSRLVYEPDAIVSHICEDTLISLAERFWRWRFHFYNDKGFYKDTDNLCRKIQDNMGLCNELIESDLRGQNPALIYVDFFLPTALILKDILFFYQSKLGYEAAYNKRVVNFVAFLEMFTFMSLRQDNFISILRKEYKLEQIMLKFILVFGKHIRDKYPRMDFYKIWLKDIIQVFSEGATIPGLAMNFIESIYRREDELREYLGFDETAQKIYRSFSESFNQFFDHVKMETVKDISSMWVLQLEKQYNTIAQSIIDSSSYLDRPDDRWQMKEDCDYYYSRILNYPLLPPQIIQFDFMRRCQLQCRICKIWSDASGQKNKELNYEEVCRLLDQARQAGIRECYFSGGEPLLITYLLDALKYAKEKGMYTQVTTNGELLNHDLCRELVRLPLDQLNVSVDGACPTTHDYIRNRSGLFDTVLRNIQELIRLKKDSGSSCPGINLGFVVNSRNYCEMVDYVKLGENLGVDYVFFQPYLTENNNYFYRTTTDEFVVPSRELDALYDQVNKLIDYKKKLGRQDFISNTVQSLEDIKDYFAGRLQPAKYCFAGFNRINILTNNKVNICSGDIGDFSRASLKEILFSERAEKMRKKVTECTCPCATAAAYYPGPALSDIFLIVKKELLRLQGNGLYSSDSLGQVKQLLMGYRNLLTQKGLVHEVDKLDIILSFLDSEAIA